MCVSLITYDIIFVDITFMQVVSLNRMEMKLENIAFPTATSLTKFLLLTLLLCQFLSGPLLQLDILIIVCSQTLNLRQPPLLRCSKEELKFHLLRGVMS